MRNKRRASLTVVTNQSDLIGKCILIFEVWTGTARARRRYVGKGVAASNGADQATVGVLRWFCIEARWISNGNLPKVLGSGTEG